MLRFLQPDKQDQGGFVVALDPSTVSTMPATANAIEEPAVARFLDDVMQRLAPLKDDVHAGIRQELRVHLETLIAAHEELGDDHEAAFTAAVRQFGEPSLIARRFRRAWAATPADTPRAAMREALRLFSVALIAYSGINAVENMLMRQPLQRLCGTETEELIWLCWFWGAMLALPILAGARVGLKFPRRGGVGVFCALSAMVAVAAPCLTAYSGIIAGHSATLDALDLHARNFWYVCVYQNIATMPFLSVWLLIGCISAAVAGALKLKTKRRLRPRSFANI